MKIHNSRSPVRRGYRICSKEEVMTKKDMENRPGRLLLIQMQPIDSDGGDLRDAFKMGPDPQNE